MSAHHPIGDDKQDIREVLYALTRRLAKGLIYDPDLRGDVVHDTILKVLELLEDQHKLSQWKPHQQSPYLRRMVKNTYLRGQLYNRRLPLLGIVEDKYVDMLESIAEDEAYEPYHLQVTALELRLKQMLRKVAQETLDEEMFEIFQARLRGCSYKEIFENTGRKPGACRKLMSTHILPRLARAYRERGLI